MADLSRPPKPDCDFDFNLPHGVDVEDTVTPTQDRDPVESLIDCAQVDENAMEDLQHTSTNSANLSPCGEVSTQQVTNYAALAEGFSDDEGGEEAFDRSWPSRRPKRAPPPLKKSPRRWEEGDGDDEASPTKRARRSLFGGPVEEGDIDDEQQSDVRDNSAASNDPEPDPDIDDGMSSLHIDSIRQDVEEQSTQMPAASPTRSTSLASVRDSQSPPSSSVFSEDEVEIPPDTQPVYDLRQNIDRLTSTTYVDTDKTGNYDPSQEAKIAKNVRLRALQKQKEKAAKKEIERSKSKKKGKGKAQEDPIEKCIAVLHFKNFGNVRNLTNEEENWPLGHSDIDTDWALETEQYREFYRSNTPGVQQIAIDDPSGELDDLTGHPEARGCQECRRFEIDCAMVHGSKFPCEQCLDDGLDCRTILRPKENGICERCLKDGEECSFKSDPKQASCDHCSFGQHVCVPIPPHDYRTPRISLDKELYGPDRKHLQCTHCRREQKRCSLKKKTDRPPCKFCKKNGLGCHFEDLPKTTTVEQKQPDKKNAEAATRANAPEVSRPDSKIFSAADIADMHRESTRNLERETTPKIEMEDEAGNKGMLTKIHTSFANPVKFNFLDDYAPDCNFCEMPMFGFVGHFEREVHVISWHNGLGHTEVGGGHTTEQGDPDRMCKVCVFMRIQISCCDDHAFEHLPDTDRSLDFEAMADDLISAEPGSTDFRYQQSRWCTLCFTPAIVGCGARQESMMGRDDEEVIGCGARLCEGCFEALQGNFAGNFEYLAKVMGEQPKTAEGDEHTGELQSKPRADIDFIRQEGLLMRCASAGQGE